MLAMPGQQRTITRSSRQSKKTPSRAARRFGYGVAVAVNLALLIIVNNVLAWGWFSFLTDDFEEVVPIVSLSLVAGAVGNLAFIVFDERWFKSIGEIVMAVFSMAATVRVYQVFPFDFTAYDFDWEPVARGILIVAMVGIVISVLVELSRLGRFVFREQRPV